MPKNTYYSAHSDYILRIERPGNRAENRLYKTEKRAVNAAKRLAEREPDSTCRIFQEIGAVRQISLFELEPDF